MPSPSFAFEESLEREGYRLVAGVDEVGRGALAGPVVAVAIVLPPQIDAPWVGAVRDSKQLLPLRRHWLFPQIRGVAIAMGAGMVSSEEIDACGILEATRQAMCQAINQLSPVPDFLLIDGLELPALPLPQKGLVKGDSLCFSIACASILAKVVRDGLMEELDSRYPGYGFKQHKGYGTSTHLTNLKRLGPSPVHRKSFAPVRELLP